MDEIHSNRRIRGLLLCSLYNHINKTLEYYFHHFINPQLVETEQTVRLKFPLFQGEKVEWLQLSLSEMTGILYKGICFLLLLGPSLPLGSWEAVNTLKMVVVNESYYEFSFRVKFVSEVPLCFLSLHCFSHRTT